MNYVWHLAQMNVATGQYPLDDPRMRGFMNQLDNINAMADAAPGFIWRLQSDSGNATDIDVGGDPLFIVNLSVWASADALFEFVYKTAHRNVMVQRRSWFEKPEGLYQVLWWVAAGHTPTPQEGLDRLALLQRNGPSVEAFTFRSRFPHPGVEGEPSDLHPEPYCSGWD